MQQSECMAMMQGEDGTLGTAESIAAYEQGIDDLRAAVTGMTAEQVLARPVPGKWSTAECVGHLANTEIFFTDRIVRTIAMDRPLFMSADEKQYIERLPRRRTPARGRGWIHVLLFEPATTLNTGDVRDERTVELLDRI